VDLGSRRIGVAISDSGGAVASPLEVVQRCGSPREDHRRLISIAAEWEAEIIVVGLPLSLDGSVGSAARAALSEVQQLRQAAAVPVVTVDERLTTVSANRQLRDLGLDNRRSRKVIDMHAAAVLLQSWLDGNRTQFAGSPDEPPPDGSPPQGQSQPQGRPGGSVSPMGGDDQGGDDV
jgi:putative Holliday junction resolvase